MIWPSSGNGSFLRRWPAVLVGLASAVVCLGVVVRLQAGTLSAIAPSGASATVSIQVTGTGFDGTAANNEVTFRATTGESAVAVPTAVTVINAAQGVRRLTVRVPSGLPIGRADVTVVNRITGEASTGLWLEVVGLTLPEATSGAPGAANLRVRITGSANAKFAAGSRAIFGTGITVNSTTVESPTSVVATISIAATAAVGPRTVTVVTTTQTVSLVDGFLVSTTPPPPPVNAAPIVNAGADQAITLPAGTTLTGSVSDDGLPAGAALTIGWTQVSGPGAATIGSPNAATSPVTFSDAGVYVLRLTGSDGALAAADEVTITVSPAPPPPNRNPTANAGGPYAVIAGQTLTFNGSGSDPDSGDTLTLTWAFGDGDSGAGASPTHAYLTAGPFTATLTVNDGRGGIATAQASVVVTARNRNPTADAGGPYAVIAGQTLTFNGSGSDLDSGDTLTLTWAFGDGGSGTGGSPTHTYATAGSFTATLTVNDGRGGVATAQASVVVTAPNRNPTANAGGPYAATVGAAIAFSGAASLDPDADTLSFAWLFGDGSAGAGVGPTHAFAAPGTYTATLLVGDGHGGADTATTIVQVSDMAAAPGNRGPVANAGGPYAGMRGQSLAFDAAASADPDGDPLAFAWSFGDGESGTGPATAHTYAQAGEYVVSLLVADGRGGSDLASARVMVSGVAVAGNQMPTVGAGGPYAGLAGSPVTFSATGSDPDGDALIFAWSFGDGSSGSGPTPSHTYLGPGPYSVVVSVSDQRGGSATASTTSDISGVAGNTAPIASAGGPYLGAPGQELTFNFAASSDADQDPLTFSADFGDGGTGAGSAPAHTYAQPGTYLVTLVVSDGRGGAHVATTSAVIVGQTTPQNRGPIANAGGPYAAAPGQLVQFDGSVSSDPDADPLTFSWSFGDGGTGTTATPAHVFANPGQYDVALLLTDGRGGTAAATATVIVTLAALQNQAPTGTAGGPYTATLGDVVTFAGAGSDLDGDTLTLSWNFGDGSTGTGNTPQHVYARAGDYPVVLLVSDGRGGSATVDAIVHVTPRATENRTPAAHAGGPYAGAPQLPVTFDGSQSTDPDGDALTFGWTFGDGTNGSGAAPSHAYANAGAYLVTLTVTDARGQSASTSTSAVIGTVVDRGPPIVTLSAPTEALPGSLVVITATAADDVAVTGVRFEVGGETASEHPTAPYQRTVQVPGVATPGAIIHIRAIARDPSNNTGQADADLRITVQPDTENPRVSLILPPSATPGTSVPVSATALDNVGIARVVFLVGGTPISEDAQAPYEATVLVPANAVAGSTLPIVARAVDFSGNTVEGGSALSIVAEADTIAPTVSLTAPAEVLRGGTLQVSATAADNAAVYGVTFYVNDVPLATDTTAPYAASLQLGAAQPAGTTLQLRAVARDFAGLEGVATAQSLITAPAEGGRGILTGEVYDDTSGLPLAGAVVVLTGRDDSGAAYAESTTSDARGRYILRANTGVGVLQVTRVGWTRVDRPITVVAQRAVEVVDARLTRFSIAGAAISPVLGGVVGSESDRLTMPPGALQAAATLALTPISQQGLQGLLPPGWSPVGGVDVTPHELAFNGVAQLRVSNRFGLAAGTPLVVARWDETASAWRAVGATIAGGPTDGLQADSAGGGQYAWLLADRAPSAPAVPALGDLLTGTNGGVIPPQTTPRIDPQPSVAFYSPGISSAVRAFVDTAAALPSGSVLWIDVSETYRFFSGAETHPEPYVQDLVFYQTPDNALSQSASFPATPSLVFDALSLERGVITLEMLVPPATPAPPALAGPDGGVIVSGDASLAIPAGALGDFAPIELHGLQQTDLGIAVPPGLAFVGGAQIGFPGTLASSAALSLPAPSGNADNVLLVRLQEIQGQSRLVLSGIGTIANGRLVSIATAGGSSGLEGIRSAGRYFFFQALTPVGFASGQVLGVAGAPFPAALITSPGLPIVSLSGASGTYLAAAPAGAATLTALDTARSDSGAATATLVAAQVSPLDIRLAAQAPRVLSIVPAANSENVPLGSPVVVTFSEPIDPASVASGGVVTLTPAGGSPVPGAFLLATGNTVLTFRPDTALEPNRRYTATVGTSIRDLAGYALGAPVSASFDSLDTLPPPQPPAGTLALTIPVNGATTVSATQGTAGAHDTVSIVNVTRGSSTPVLLEPNGGFSVRVETGLNDRLQLKMVDPSGNVTVVTLGRFRDPDGSVVVGSEGGIVEGPNGSALEVEPGTFPAGSIIRFVGLTEAQVNAPMTSEYPFVAGFEITSSATPQRYINLSVPAPPGVSPSQQGIVAKVVTAFGQPALSIVDTAKIIDGRLRTSSPPCPGILERFGRYAMYLNNDEAMQRFGIALLSMAVPRTVTTTFPEIIIQPFGLLVPPVSLFPPLQFDVPYYPATPFVAHVLTQGTPQALGQALFAAAQVCLPVPADRPVKIVIRNAVSGQVIQAANQTAPPAGTSQAVVTDYVDPSDSERPSLFFASWSPQPPHLLEPGEPIALVFSERVQLLTSQQEPEAVYLLTSGAPGQSQVRVTGTAVVDSSGRVLTFQPAHRLEMGKTFTLQVPGVRDLAGNRFRLATDPALTFKTFAPYVAMPSGTALFNRDKMYADLSQNANPAFDSALLPEAALRDLGFVTRTPAESADGQWHTTLSALVEKRGLGYKLLNVDASDPRAPVALNALTGGDRIYPRLKVYQDFYLTPRLLPLGGDPANVAAWRSRILHYVVEDPSLRMCVGTNTPPAELQAWQTAHTAPNHTFATRIGGCGHLGISASYSIYFSIIHFYDLFDPATPTLLGQRTVSDNGTLFNPPAPRRSWAPAGRGFARGLDILPNIDFTHEVGPTVDLNTDTVGVYIPMNGLGLGVIDLERNVPTISDFAERIQRGGTVVDSEGFYGFPYYQDVSVVRGKIVAVSSDNSDGSELQLLEVFDPTLATRTGVIPLSIQPRQVTSVEALVQTDADGNGTPENHDIAFVSGFGGGLALVEISPSGAPVLVGQVATPTLLQPDAWGTVVTALRHVAVDKEQMLAYVGASWYTPQGEFSGIMVVDVRRAFGPFSDTNNDQRDDRILALVPVLGPGQAAGLGGILWEFRFDPQRRLIYAAIDASVKDGAEHGLAILKACECTSLNTAIKLTTGVVQAANGSQTSFPSADGTSSILFVTTSAQGGQVRATFEAEFAVNQPVTYSITEAPFGASPTILNLSTGATGVFDPSNPRIVMSLSTSVALARGSLVYVDFLNDQGVVLKRAVLVLLPAAVEVGNARITTVIDRINRDVTSSGGELAFVLSSDAVVTVRVDGNVITQTPSLGQPPVVMQDVRLPAGRNRLFITPDMVSVPGEHAIEIQAVFSDQNITAIGVGVILHEVRISEFLPVGHKFVKGVDLYDGHLTLQREDVSIAGVSPNLQFVRSYGSVGTSSAGPMGAGWSHAYMGRVIKDAQNKVTVIGGEGSGSRFFNPISITGPQGQPQVQYRPQAGYHGTLIYDAQADSFEYISKERTRYRYEFPAGALAGDDRVYRLAFIEDPHGNRSTLTYDQQTGNLSEARDPSGRALTFQYAPRGIVPEDRIIEIRGPDGIVVTYGYDGYGNLTRATRGNRAESYAYSVADARDRHNLISTTGPNHGTTGSNADVTAFEYFADNDTFPGEQTVFDWNRSILIIPQKFELVKNVIEGHATPEASTTHFTFDYSQIQSRLVTVVRDPIGTETTYTMHLRGSVIEERAATAQGDNVTQWTWSFQETPPIDDVYITRKVDPNGQITRYTYDPNGNVTSETVDYSPTGYAPVSTASGAPLSAVVTTYDYDPVFSKIRRRVDSEGNVTTYGLDSNTGDILTVTMDPADGTGPQTSVYTYRTASGLNGLLDTITDPRGLTTHYSGYDAYGNATTIVDSAGNTQTNTFDVRSRKRATVDTFGHSDVFSYDDFDRILSVTKAAGSQPSDVAMASADETTATTYLPGGQRLTTTNGLGYITTYEYDALNRPVVERGETIDADGNAVSVRTEFAYDGNGNRVRELDRRGITRFFDYDELNRLVGLRVIASSGAVQQTAQYTYDAAGNRLTEADIHGHISTFDYDGLYRKVRTQLPLAPYALTTTIDSLGNMLRTTDANGHATEMAYDGMYRLRSKTDAAGVTTTFEYDDSGNRSRETNLSTGLVIEYGPYDGLNRPTTVIQRLTDPITGALVVYTTTNSYNDADHTRSVVNPRGMTVTERYNGTDRLIERTIDATGLGLTTTYKYDGGGNVGAVKDPEGSVPDVINSFDGLNRRIRTDVLLGGTERVYYDGNGNVIRTVDKRGVVTRHEYDHLDRSVVDIIEQSITGGPERAVTTTTYDDAANRLEVMDANGHVTTHNGDALHREVLGVDALGQETRSEWDGVNKTADIDARGTRTEFGYGPANRLIATRDYSNGQLISSTTTEYLDALNQRIDTDRSGLQTIAKLDALGRVRQLVRRDPRLAANYGVTEFVAEDKLYDQVGNTVQVTDANGGVTRFVFDGADRRTVIIEGFGSPVQAATTYTYDGMGNVLTMKKGRNTGSPFDIRYTYDDRHRKVTQENGVGDITRYTYDQSDNVLTVTEPRGPAFTTAYTYDEVGKLLTVDEGRGQSGGITEYTYDGVRNRTSQRDPTGSTTTFRYDALNRLTDSFAHVTATPNEQTARHWHYEYDGNDNQILIADPLGQQVIKAYDSLDRLISKTYTAHATASDGSEVLPKPLSTTYEYDLNGNDLRVLELKTNDGQTQATEVTQMTYDALSRQVTRTNADGKTVGTTYDRRGNTIAQSDADGVVTLSQYDARSQLSGVTAEFGVQTGQTTYEYFPDLLLRKTTYPNGVVEEREYDAASRVTRIVSHIGNPADPHASYLYTYDANGNPILQTEQHRQLRAGASESTQYSYDALNRLASAIYPNGETVAYTYAPNGNRLTEIGTSPLTHTPVNRAFSYNHLNELTGIRDAVTPSASEFYRYDANGNNVERVVGEASPDGTIANPVSVRGFDYNIRDQLASADQAAGGGRVTLDYDFSGRRTKLTTPFLNVRFLYDTRDVVQEYDSASMATTLKYNYAGPRLLSMVAPAAGRRNSYFYLFDGRTNPSELTDESGAVSASYAYDVWGASRVSFDTTPNRRKFAGGYADPEIGLHLFGARYYDDAIGRFTARDPFPGLISDPASLHPYMYANANPMVYVDPDGRFVHIIAGAAVGAIGGCIVGAITDAGCAKGALVGGAVGGLAAATFGASMAATGGAGFGAFVGAEALGGGVVAGTYAGSALISGTVAGIVAGGAGGILGTMAGHSNSFDEFFSKKTWSEHGDEAIANGFAGALVGGIGGAASAALAEAVLAPSGVSAIRSQFLSNALGDVVGQGAAVRSGMADEINFKSAFGGAALQTGLGYLPQVPGAAKRWGQENFPASGASAPQRRMLQAFGRVRELEIGIRSPDPATALGTRLLTEHTNIQPKGMDVKTKSTVGFVYNRGQYRQSDLDIAYVRDLRTGKFLTNDEVLARVVKPMNRISADRFPGRAQQTAWVAGEGRVTNAAEFFQHGAHLTALDSSAVHGDWAKYGQLGSPGSVTTFGTQSGPFTMNAGGFRSFAVGQGQAWHPAWDVPFKWQPAPGWMSPFNTVVTGVIHDPKDGK